MATGEASGPPSRRADEAQALFERVDALARTLGFDFCGYLLRMPWTGEGKMPADISTILDISERTVNFHIGNALLKLNATNKVQAVVKALTLGLMDAG
ncbi:LuxR C-terminal-related transcriptional regulator [Myxococcus sp. MISCRS1]|uniref:LuxR C-terminal-related transcriptional regulator n=1 Tax=Myxococcus sp. MISCRS1 TaxID=2996786 RepID=UPI002D1E4224|nr:LuxR C-terminal-related transcriptional regulator [Myxococcus sp. MISCRS1]